MSKEDFHRSSNLNTTNKMSNSTGSNISKTSSQQQQSSTVREHKTTTNKQTFSKVREVHVNESHESLIDKDFQRKRDEFDDNIKRMEDEMNAFRSKVSTRERELDSRAISPNTKSKEMQTFMDTCDSPLVKETKDGHKVLELKFDLTDYAPEEISLKTVDNTLVVHAKHEEKTETRSVFREYNREFLLPANVDPEQIKSSLSAEGVLTVEAPLPTQSTTKRVQIASPKRQR